MGFELKNKQILVTGATGLPDVTSFIGRHFVDGIAPMRRVRDGARRLMRIRKWLRSEGRI